MTVVAIHIGPREGDDLELVQSAAGKAGKGLDGDRHFHADGAGPGQALTLVEDEVVRSVALPLGATRRQLTVRGVRLAELIGQHFLVGSVHCFGVEICEPCSHLERLTRPGIIKDLVHRGGINADLLSDGVIKIGDTVTPIDHATEGGEL